jgi:hypothetical protein
MLSPEDRALAPEWLPEDWPAWAASVWVCPSPCGYIYRRQGPIVPKECIDCGPSLIHYKRCHACREWKARDGYSVMNVSISDRLRADCKACRSKAEAAKQRAKTERRAA